jgi:hypothetical protein
MAKKCTEKGEERIGDTVKPFDTAVRRHLTVPAGSGGFGRLFRQNGLKMITFPAPFFLTSGQICSDQSLTINGS